MKRELIFFASKNRSLFNALFVVALLLGAGWVAGCATTAPVNLDLNEAVTNPQAYKNERVALTGYVLDYEPARGDTYRTLSFTLGLVPEEKISVFCAGYTADAIAKASLLVGEAFETHGLITAVGKVKMDRKNPDAPPELRLESVEYKGESVNVRRGPTTRAGFSVGGWYFTPSVGIGATIHP